MDQPIGLRSKTLLKHRSFPVLSAEGTSASNPTPRCLPLCYVISMWTIPLILLTALHLHAQCTKPWCHMLGSFTVSAAGCARATRFARVLMSATRFVRRHWQQHQSACDTFACACDTARHHEDHCESCSENCLLYSSCFSHVVAEYFIAVVSNISRSVVVEPLPASLILSTQ